MTCENGKMGSSNGPRRARQRSRGMADLREQIDMTKRTCDLPECDKAHFGRGYCNTHLKRLQTTGTVELKPRLRKTCAFAECGRPAVSHGLCSGHNQQAKRGSELRPLRRKLRSTDRDEHGRKQCGGCACWKTETEFYPAARMDDGLAPCCKRCDRSQRLQRNYGITADRYDALLIKQGGGCAICGEAPKPGRSLAVDHDHACCQTPKRSCGRCLRGLLCDDCNRVLGMFRDRVSRFRAAITYLGGAE